MYVEWLQMTPPKRVTRTSRNSKKNPAAKVSGRKPARGKGLSLMASAEKPVDDFSLTMEQYLAIYRPLKKPVTIRLDADVIAWFKKGGGQYQRRINRALREVMMAERKKKERG